MNMRDLAIEFTSYEHYISSHEWARERSVLPVLACVAPDISQEKRMQRAAQAKLTHAPGLVLWMTTAVLLNEYGPLAPIWLQTIQRRSQRVQSEAEPRCDLFHMLPEAMSRHAGAPSVYRV
jgi:hypothetical protein